MARRKDKIYCELLHVSEKEVDDLLTDSVFGKRVGPPTRYCVLKSGALKFWPPYQPGKLRLFFTVED